MLKIFLTSYDVTIDYSFSNFSKNIDIIEISNCLVKNITRKNSLEIE